MSHSTVCVQVRAMKKGLIAVGRPAERPNKSGPREIDRRVSQIRNLLTMLRKAIHLDGREERASIDPPRVTGRRRAAATILSRASHVVSGPRLLRERERETRPPPPPRSFECRDCIRDGAIIYITSELVNKRRRCASDAEACRNRLFPHVFPSSFSGADSSAKSPPYTPFPSPSPRRDRSKVDRDSASAV